MIEICSCGSDAIWSLVSPKERMSLCEVCVSNAPWSEYLVNGKLILKNIEQKPGSEELSRALPAWVSSAHLLLEKGLGKRPISWREVRFVGLYMDLRRADPRDIVPNSWSRKLLDKLRRKETPDGVIAVKNAHRDEWNQWTIVHPDAVIWDGYSHANGDPQKKPRPGKSGNESTRKHCGLFLRPIEDDADRFRSISTKTNKDYGQVLRLLLDTYEAQIAPEKTST